MNRVVICFCALVCVFAYPLLTCVADDPVFSGPQVGEKLVPFKILGVYDDEAGKELDFVTQAQGKPLVLVFVHKLTRPSHAVTRLLMQFGAQRKKDGLFFGAVYLYDDLTAGTERLKPIQQYLPKGVSVGISADGVEGPGAYGLNRNVTLTILVANQNKVTANFAIVQPNVPTDVPKILNEVVKLIGGKVPTLDELGAGRYQQAKKAKKRRQATSKSGRSPLAPELESLVRELIQKTADADEVDEIAVKIEEFFEKKPEARRQVGQRAQRIIDGGKLTSYGTAKAQEYLKKWANHVASKKDKQASEGKGKDSGADKAVTETKP